MNPTDRSWQKLTTLARQAPAVDDCSIPPGFATRVVARAFATPAASPWFNLERFALRGFLAAAVCGVAAMTFTYFDRTSDQLEEIAGVDDAVVTLLDIS
jgi:hypothetical protein